VVGHSFDQTCQHFPGFRLRTHAHHRISRFTLASRPLIRFGTDAEGEPYVVRRV
jgi:hypothetical protein